MNELFGTKMLINTPDFLELAVRLALDLVFVAVVITVEYRDEPVGSAAA